MSCTSPAVSPAGEEYVRNGASFLETGRGDPPHPDLPRPENDPGGGSSWVSPRSCELVAASRRQRGEGLATLSRGPNRKRPTVPPERLVRARRGALGRNATERWPRPARGRLRAREGRLGRAVAASVAVGGPVASGWPGSPGGRIRRRGGWWGSGRERREGRGGGRRVGSVAPDDQDAAEWWIAVLSAFAVCEPLVRVGVIWREPELDALADELGAHA
jgi:hypothetical protein